MSCKSAIYVVNTNPQTLAVNETVELTNIIRRYGCAVNLDSNAIAILERGYYSINANIIAEPEAAGTVTVQAYQNGQPISGATASATVAGADTQVTLPIAAIVRNIACAPSNITFVLSGAASTVSNIAVAVEKI